VAAQMQSALRAAPALMRSAAPVAAAARGSHSRELREAITGLAATTRAVAGQAGALPEVEDSSAQTAQALTGTALDSSLAKLPAVTARVRDTAGALHGAIAELTPLAADLRPAAAQLAPTIARVKPLLSAAKPALAGAGPLIRNLRAGLDPAPAYAPAVSAAMAATAPTLSTANDSLLPALAKPTSLGTPAYLAFLGLFAGGGGASRPFGVDGQGHFMRFGLRFLTGAGQPLPPCSLLAKVNQQLADQLSNAGGCTP
jgi:ABC-type transporter Mla subunit MlaD